MPGSFTNTTYVSTIDQLVESTKNKINNPYYKFSDKKPTKVTYYKQNLEKTTSDLESEDIYQTIGQDAPLRFNKIIDFYIYGFSKLETNVEIGDYGLEADTMEGEAIVLPNTIVPCDGDFFSVEYIKEPVLFKVNNANSDTLYNGANVYSIRYHLETIGNIENIEKQVVKTYRFSIQNVGTDFNCLLEEGNYELVEQLDSIVASLCNTYQVFFESGVQNFVFSKDGFKLYDPYLIEFMIRNKVLSHGDEYVYVDHGCAVPRTFAYDYSKSFFSLLEDPSEIGKKEFINYACGEAITDINSLFTTRQETYYKVEYIHNNPYSQRFNIFPDSIVDMIQEGIYANEEDLKPYNLFLAYMRGDSDYINENIINILKYTDYISTQEFYYLIPIDIFIINKFAENLMK